MEVVEDRHIRVMSQKASMGPWNVSRVYVST